MVIGNKSRSGQHNLEATRKKISKGIKKYLENPENKQKRMNQLSKIHEFRKGKTFEEIFGEEKSKNMKLINSKKHKELWKNGKINISREKNGMWAGNNVGINGLHNWLRKYKLYPEFCEECEKNKRLDLANMKNHKYTRNPEDYKWLCRKCHIKLDRGIKCEVLLQ